MSGVCAVVRIPLLPHRGRIDGGASRTLPVPAAPSRRAPPATNQRSISAADSNSCSGNAILLLECCSSLTPFFGSSISNTSLQTFFGVEPRIILCFKRMVGHLKNLASVKQPAFYNHFPPCGAQRNCHCFWLLVSGKAARHRGNSQMGTQVPWRLKLLVGRAGRGGWIKKGHSPWCGDQSRRGGGKNSAFFTCFFCAYFKIFEILALIFYFGPNLSKNFRDLCFPSHIFRLSCPHILVFFPQGFCIPPWQSRYLRPPPMLLPLPEPPPPPLFA